MVKLVVVVASLACALSVSCLPFDEDSQLTLELRDKFVSWARLHQKNYETKTEMELRFRQYLANKAVVDAHNAGSSSYQLTIDGPFADMSFEDFKAFYLMAPQNCSATSSGPVPHSPDRLEQLWGVRDLPSAVDWRTKGVITPIKNQLQCGSCWTFSTTGSLEAHTCIKLGRDCSNWIGLSEQQLVDCAQDFNNHGCNGGLPSQAFEYIHHAGGIEEESSYPYTHVDGECKFDQSKSASSTLGSFNITALDEDDIVRAVASVGPVSIAFQVASDFHLYSAGVYDSTVCQSGPEDVNHAVVVVGYGTTDPHTTPTSDFYIIRNSWGNLWGMEGYFWMVRGKNMCGVSDCASYPLL